MIQSRSRHWALIWTGFLLTTTVASAEIVLPGTGIQQNFDSTCIPPTLTDFIETAPATNRRIEPKNCALVNVSTPIFSWPLPSDIVPKSQMKVDVMLENLTVIKTLYTDVPRALYPDALPAGRYTWRVFYHKINSSTSWTASQIRHFQVLANSFIIPSEDSFTALVISHPHPRVLPVGKTFADIANLATISASYKNSFNTLLSKANEYMSAPISAVPPNWDLTHFGGDKQSYDKWLTSVRDTAQKEALYIETLLYASRLQPSSSVRTNYENAAIQRINELVKWSDQGPSGQATQDQANRVIFLSQALSLDFIRDRLSPTDRTNLANMLRARLASVIKKFPDFDLLPYQSHLLTATMFITESLMHVVGLPEFSSAQDQQWLRQSWRNLITMGSIWGGSFDGGFANGTGYGWVSVANFARVMAAVRVMTNINLGNWTPFGKFGDNQLAFTPPGIAMRGQMGDGIENTGYYFLYAATDFRLLAAVTGRPEYEWYWRAYAPNLTQSDPLMPLQYMLLGTLPQVPSLNANFTYNKNSFLFEDAGFVAMHSQTTSSQRTSVFFRSSRFGAFDHSHADNNGITFVSKGKELLISGGYYPYYGSHHHLAVGRATRYKNTMTFDGGIGQSEPTADPAYGHPGEPVMSMDAGGKLLNFADNGTWVIATGDATLAYRGREAQDKPWYPLLNKALRTVAYNRQLGLVLIYDYATSDKPRLWELNFQSINLTDVRSSQYFIVSNGTARACINVWAPAGGFTTHDKFDVTPEPSSANIPEPEQIQTRYRYATATNTMMTVTIIREDCNQMSIQPQFTDGSTQLPVLVNGVKALTFDKAKVSLWP